MGTAIVIVVGLWWIATVWGEIPTDRHGRPDR
jgi:hypothetical protein